LGKYDDEFTTGKSKSEGFRLGAVTNKKMEVDDEDEGFARIGQAPATKVKLNLDYASEYLFTSSELIANPE
jgi:U4/U6.U5 tri-snRNP-associated protein 1